MTADELAHSIQLILAPVVMITACAITLNGVMSHYQAVSDRLRTMTRERLDLLHGKEENDQIAAERLAELDYQAPELLRRHRVIRDSLVAIDVAMVLLVLCMLAIAMAPMGGTSVLSTLVMALFLLATCCLLVGVALSAVEVSRSRRAIAYEVNRVLKLKRES
jgi:hypothetical protein